MKREATDQPQDDLRSYEAFYGLDKEETRTPEQVRLDGIRLYNGIGFGCVHEVQQFVLFTCPVARALPRFRGRGFGPTDPTDTSS